MTDWVAPTTEALQAEVVAEADEQTLILTSGGRLARQLRHAFRLDRIKKGQSGWLTPKVLSLNAWIEETWRCSWPEETPASPIKIIELWEKSVQMLDLPEGLTADIPLYQTLDETYRAKIRDKVPPIKNGHETPLMVWREEIFRRFEKLLLEQGLIHPSILPIKVLDEKIIKVRPRPKKVFLLGFAFPAPIETDLLKFLIKYFKAVSCLSKINQEPALTAVSLPDQEEEVAWLIEQVLLEAQHTPCIGSGLSCPIFPSMPRICPRLSKNSSAL